MYYHPSPNLKLYNMLTKQDRLVYRFVTSLTLAAAHCGDNIKFPLGENFSRYNL